MRYPWQAADWARIRAEFERMPNAWLFAGPAGIGKRAFAEQLAQALLCEAPLPDGHACGQCEACRWLAAGHHPDYRVLSPELEDEGGKEGKTTRKLPMIKIEAVRELIDFAHLTAHRSGRRVIIVEPAEAMNLAAANALLKILEEPPKDVLFLLVSHNRERLLPTIKSRCRPFVLTRPSQAQALAWLQQAGVQNAEAELAQHGGVPLFDHDPALSEARRQLLKTLTVPTLASVLAFAEKVERDKLAFAQVLEWLMKWLADLSSLRLAEHIRYYPEERAALTQLAARADPAQLMKAYDTLLALVPFAQHTLNTRLQIEAALLEYLNCFAAPRAA
jgi:DNA polymerase-3 subunit delta'